MGSLGLGCDIKYIALLYLGGRRSRCVVPVLARYTAETLVSLSSTFYDTSHLSRPSMGSLLVNWNLSHSQTDPWFRVTLVSKEEVWQPSGIMGIGKDQELLRRAKTPMEFL